MGSGKGLRLAAYGPLIVLALVSALSLAARSYDLGAPCESPCTTLSDHVLLFDESYYVNAGEVIAGIHPVVGELWGPYYQNAKLGTDPNGEHPQGAKLVIARAIELFGNGPFAWRIGSLVFASLAILGMYVLVRSAGGGPWLAVGAATLMAADNLMIVSGRVGMLDIYALAPMVWGVALYLRKRVLAAAVLLAIADCMKEVAVFALIALALFELGRVTLRARDDELPAEWAWREALKRLAIAGFASMALFVAGLWVMGLIAPPYGDTLRLFPITGGPFGHLWHIISYGGSYTTSGSQGNGFSSPPWKWLLDRGANTYWRVLSSYSYGHGPHAIRPVGVWFRAMISPPILALAIPAFVLCAARALWRRSRSRSVADVQMSLLALAWFIGTWGPFELMSALDKRVTFFYYMVIVMPGIYLAVAYLVSLLWRQRHLWLRGVVVLWALGVLAAAVLMYPFVGIY